MTNINYDFIESLEGFTTTGVVPDPLKSKSGVTIGSGVDLGARNVNDLKKLNLPKKLIDKLTPYLGRKRGHALDFVNRRPLDISKEDARLITNSVREKELDSLAKQWKKDTGKDFSELPENKATAVASVAFQYGNLASETPNYWKQVTSDDWEGAYANLRNFEDRYSGRREKEAAFLGPHKGSEPILPTLKPIIQARQEGGPVNAGQPYLVGEDGPELIIPDQDGTVIPSANTQAEAAVDQLLAEAAAGTAGTYEAIQQNLNSSSPSFGQGKGIYIPGRDRTPKRKVKYVAFDDPTAPRIAVPEEFTPEQVQEYMKSEEAEALMYQQGYLYKYGNQPSSLKDASDQDDWALTAGIKSGYDNLKSIGAGALYTVADVFGDEEKMAQFESMISQYNQDASVHAYKPGEAPGEYDLRITSVEAILQDENKLNAFLDWAAFNVGAGATTMVPIMLASAVGAGIAVVGAPITAASGASIAGMMAAYTMGVGEVTGAQLERSGDANAALSLAAGVPYAAAERYLGTSMIFTRLLGKKYGADVVSDIVKGVATKKLVEKKITPTLVKEMAKGFGKEFAGEGVTEAIQEVITSSAAELNEGASLGELYQSKDFWKQIGEAAAAGSIAGGTIGGAGGIITYGRKSGTKNRDGALSIKKDPTPDAETMDKVDAEIGDTIEYTGSSTDESVEFILAGTGVLPNGDSIYVVTNTETGLPDYIKVDNAPKIRKSQLNESDVAALNESFLPEGTKVDKTFNKKYKAARKKLERQGVINRDRTESDIVGLSTLEDFYEEELEAYELAVEQQKQDKLTGKEVKPIAYKYKTYQGLEGDKFKEAAKIQYENQKKRDIVNFSETSAGSLNELTDVEKTELSKLGYYKGPKGVEFINRKLASVEPKDRTTRGLQDLRDIIINQTPNTPLVVEYNREVSRTQVPPLIPSSFNQTALELEPDQAARLEELTEEKQRYDWELAKADEEIAQLKDNLASLDPTASNIAAETTRITNEINNKESLKQAVAREKSDPLVRIFKIKKLLNNMINSGFKVNMLPTYRAALRQAKIEKDEASIKDYQSLINNYKPTKEHVMLFGDSLVYYDTTKAQQQMQAQLTEIERSMRAILPTPYNYAELSDDNKILYRKYFKDAQKRINAIKSIDSRRAELNSLLASFNIEPVINWDKQQGKLSIPAFNKTVKELFGYEKVAKEKVRDEYWSLGDNPNSDDRPALSQETIDKMPMVLENLRTELNRLGVGNLDMRLYDNILNENGAQVNGRFLGGLGMIDVAMNASQSVNGRKLNAADSRMFTMHHESMHYIFKELLTPQEQTVLKSAARTAYMKRYNTKRRYQKFNLSEEALLEESISDAFAEYMAVTKNGELYSPKGIIGTIFNRIKNYLIALGNALSNNQLRSTAQIFNNIDNGVMQARRDIKNKINVSETEMINLASIGKISIEQANKFFNQRGRSVVVVGGKSVGSALTNKQLYRSFVINVLPKFYAVRQDPATNKLITALTNLFENMTTDSGVPNLEQANFYLQQLNALTDRELNTAAAFVQSNQEALSEINSAALLKSSIYSYAGQDIASLFELIPYVDLFKQKIVRLNRNMPTETDIRIAGTPLIVSHGTSVQALKKILAGGFIAGTDSMGMHFGTQPQAAIRSKFMGGDLTTVVNAVLHIRNPLRMKDMGQLWDAFETLNEISAFPNNPTEQYGMDLDTARPMAPALLTDVIFTPTEAAVIRKKMMAAGDPDIRQEILQDAIKAKGYDGIIYRNLYEVTDNGEGAALESLDSYIVFDADQIQLVEDNPNLDMGDINYSAATEPKEEPSADEMDKQGTEKIRQFLAEAIKGMEASQKARDKITRGKEYGGGGDISLKDLGFLSKFMQHAAGIAAKFPFVNFFYDTVKAMESKARSLQTQFAGQMSFVYEIINKMEGAKEAINRAAAIAQAQPGRYRLADPSDPQGRIVFLAPRQIIMNNGNVIEAGETVILEGDVARAYVSMIEAGVLQMQEKLRATIAGGKHIPQLREAVALLLKYNPQALQPLIDPQVIASTGQSLAQAIESLTDQNFEALTPAMIQSIVGGLQMVPQLSMDRAMNMSMGQGISTDFTALLEQIEENNATIQGLLGSETSGLTALNNEAQIFLELTSTDYVPLSRHGTHGITVKDAKGKVVYYEHLSGALTEEAVTGNTTAVKFAEARRRVQDLFPDMEVSEVVKIDDTFRKETRGALAQLDELSQHLSDKNADAYVEVRKELVGVIGSENVVGFDRFTRGRKEIGGVAGFDSDIINSMSEFGMISSEFIARDRYMRDVNKTYADALNYAKDKPRLTEAVKKMKEYGVDNAHSQEWGAVRRMGYWWFLGGNISSGILQLMSIVQFTGPILAQMSGSKVLGSKGLEASTQLSRAFTEAMRLTSFTSNEYNDVFLNLSKERLLQVFGGDKDLVQAVLDAIADGTIKQGQALYESGQAPGFSITPDEDRTNLKVRQRIKILEQQIMGGTFNTFETLSRLTGFVAAYRMGRNPETMKHVNDYFSETDLTWNAMKARKGGVATNRDFADMLVARTFGVYAKIDRPLMMRQGGAAIFLFQTYISQMFGLLRRLLVGQGSAEATAVGRRMFARIMIMLFLTGGLLGMPGADDMDFLYRMTNRMRGVNTDIRQQMKEMLTSKVGAKNTEMVMNGALETFLNVSVQRRVSLGEIPGSAQIRALMTLFGMPTGARAEEFLGAPGAVFIGTANEWKTMFQQQGAAASLTDMDFYMAAMPTFAKNMYRAAYKYPKDGFVATRRGTLVTADLTTGDLTKQFFGFTPTKVSKGREILYYEKQIDTKYQGSTTTFNAKIKNAYRDMYIYSRKRNDPDLYKEAQLRLNKVMREVIEFNNTIESNYTYVPDLNRLLSEGIKQANFNVRISEGDIDTYRQKKALPDLYGTKLP